MKVKKLYATNKFSGWVIVEMPDGRMMKFGSVPYRKITEKDLTPFPYFQAKGKNAEEADEMLYQWYGLEKED